MSRFVALPAALLGVFCSLAASAAEVNHSWDELVGALKTGNKIIVTRGNSASLEGKLVSIDGQSITIRQRTGSQTIERRDVYRVRTAHSRHPVLYGTLIGGGVGALSSWAVSRSSGKPDADIGGVLGAAAGAIVGATLPHSTTLYEATERNSATVHPTPAQ
jgi:hypothetical protein